jgi:hypothetical protein
MVWFITGNRSDLVLAVSDSGAPICHGQGKHEPRPTGVDDFGSNIDRALLTRIQAAECGWTIALPTDAEVNIDGLGEGLFDRAQKSPGESHGMIKFYAHSPDAVTFVLVAPEGTFSQFRRLLELVLLSDSLEYIITAEFGGFRVPHAQTATPTWQEFIDGKPLFFSQLSLLARVPRRGE